MAGQGVRPFAKRLDRSSFVGPPPADGRIAITQAQWR
jgi:hypothetical protein